MAALSISCITEWTLGGVSEGNGRVNKTNHYLDNLNHSQKNFEMPAWRQVGAGVGWGLERWGGGGKLEIMVMSCEYWWRQGCDDNIPLKPNYQYLCNYNCIPQ